jgi:hypothetical protein
MRLLKLLPNGDFRLRSLDMPSSLTHGGVKKLHLKIWSRIQVETRLDMRRSNSVAGRLLGMTYNISGWTVVAHSNVRSGELTYESLVHMPPKVGAHIPSL